MRSADEHLRHLLEFVDALPGVKIDTTKVHPARRYDYWLGGKDNFRVDRESGDAIAEVFPGIRTAARENRRFLKRAVRFAVKELGVRQFLDIGTGLPTADNTHEVAQSADPTCRVVYTDNDPMVLAHARALLTGTAEGTTGYLDADIRDTGTILTSDALKILDLREPVALMLVAILHFLSDNDDPHGVVEKLMAPLAPGSVLILSHASYDLLPKETVAGLRAVSGVGFYPRGRVEVDWFFRGLEPLGEREPGDASHLVGLVSKWHRNHDEDDAAPPDSEVSMWGGVGRKRQRDDTAAPHRPGTRQHPGGGG